MPTKTLIVPEEHLEQMLAQWLDKQGGPPEFREPACWSCGKKMRGKMWHVFFRGGEREAHLCRKCGEPYEAKHIAYYMFGRLHWLVRKPTATQRKKMRDLFIKMGLPL